jgi:hypothetical protein
VHQQPAKLSWQIISGASPWFTGPVAFFASYWSAGVERFRQPPALVSHWLYSLEHMPSHLNLIQLEQTQITNELQFLF